MALSKALGGGWEATFPAGPTAPLDRSRVTIPPGDLTPVGAGASNN